MVYGILRMINFAHGEIFMAGAFAGYFAAVAPGRAGHPQCRPAGRARCRSRSCARSPPWSSTAMRSLVERIAYRPLRNAPRLVPLISAIGASFFLQYSFRGLLRPGHLRLPDDRLPRGKRAPIPFLGIHWVDVLVIGAALAMMAALYLFVMRSKMGTAIRAVSEDKARRR